MRKQVLKLSTIVILFIIISSSYAQADSLPKANKDGFGPCPINGVVGNGNLTVGLDEKGTIILFSWPKASYYDHVKYMTLSEDLPDYGVKDNMGIFSGITYMENNQKKVSWFKSDGWIHNQYYSNDESNTLITESINDVFGVKVITTCFALMDKDILIQNFEIELMEGCKLKDINLIFFENYNICDYRIQFLPISDWLLDFFNDYEVFYSPEIEGVCHYKIDRYYINRLLRADLEKGTYISISSDSKPSSYQCGNELKKIGIYQDAYLDALDATLSMNENARGKVDSSMIFPLNFDQNNIADTTLYFSAANRSEKSMSNLKDAKQTSFEEHMENTELWWNNWISRANLPINAPDNILKIAKRSLLLIRLGYDSKTGSIIASPSRQAPYSLDWPRDGSFLNYALDIAGYPEMVDKHNDFYIDVQKPSGRYAMCYYSDGLIGGPIPFEIDQLGFTSWNFLEHYRFTGDINYLKKVYPSIKKMAHIATFWRDPISKLNLPANEDDDWKLKQKLRGATSVLLTLECSIEAGRLLNENDLWLTLWEKRAEELRAAIDEHFWKDTNYGDPEGGGSTLVWPLNFKNLEGTMDEHLNYLYKYMVQIKQEGDEEYGYEIKTIASLAYVWRNDSRIKELLEWFSNVPTEGTLLMGERFRIYNSLDKAIFENYVSLPHLWTHALFYIAAMFTYS